MSKLSSLWQKYENIKQAAKADLIIYSYPWNYRLWQIKKLELELEIMREERREYGK